MARILVIEDNRENRELMVYLLRAFGHTVMEANDGERGIETALREQPDLILCDIHLPGVDGYEVARALRANPRLRARPLIAVTALAMVGDRAKGLAAGFDEYIPKPIEPETFVGQIDSFLRHEQRGARPSGHAKPETRLEAQAQPRRARGTILVVDDSPVNRQLICGTLQPLGYEVWPAASVQEALALVKQSVPDLILSDLHMPGEGGFNLVRAIKTDTRLATVPFLFITSSVWGDADRATALRFGVTRFLLRPIEPQALIDAIDSCLPAGKP